MFVVVGLLGFAGVVALMMNAFNSNMVFFFSPTQVKANEVPKEHTFRLGGLVEEDSLRREDDGLTIHFNVTDGAEIVPVTYTGILPDLFREGQGIVAQGQLNGNSVFEASEVLAKHDENYMPPEVAEALEAAKQAEAAKTAEAQ